MGKLLRQHLCMGIVVLLLAVSASFAQQVSVSLTSAGSTVVGGVYAGPYTASINGGTPTQVICDDWAHDSYVPETWTANVTSLPAASGSLLWTGVSTVLALNNLGVLTQQSTPLTTASTEYNAVAWLGSQMLGTSNSAMQGQISYAIWELTCGISNCASLPFNNISGSELTAANNWLEEALNYGSFNSSGWEILNAIPGTASCPGYTNSKCPTAPPQEFLVYTPESSAVMLFGADMLGLLGLVIVFRRRSLRTSH